MRKTLILKLLLAVSLFAGYVHSEVLYSMPAAVSETSGGATVEGLVDFFIVGSGCGPSGGCTLVVGLQNTLAGTELATQAISGVTFELSNAGTALAFTGTTLGSTVFGNRTRTAAVTTITSAGATGSTGGLGGWQIQSGGTGFALENGLAASSKELIVTSSSGGAGKPGTDSSFSGTTPSYMGPVYFTISGIPGLTSSTDVSNIVLLFGDGTGTAPAGYFVVPTADCAASGSGSCSNGQIGYALPEPVSFLLAGYGLLTLFFLRRFTGREIAATMAAEDSVESVS